MSVPRRRWLAGTAGVALAAFGALRSIAFAQPASAAEERLERARLRREALRDLLARWKQVADASSGLGRRADRLDAAWSEIGAAHRSDGDDIRRAANALPRLRQSVEARAAALEAMQSSSRRAREAVARVSRADRSALAFAAREGDAAFNDRRRSEAAFDELGRHAGDDGFAGFAAALVAQRGLAATRASIAALQPGFDELVEAEARLIASLQAANAAQAAVRQAGWLSGVAEPDVPKAQSVPALKGATTGALQAYPRIDSSPVESESAIRHDAELGERAAELERVFDALSYLELIGKQRSAGMEVERSQLAGQQANAETTLAEAKTRLAADLSETVARVAEVQGAIGSQQRAIEQLQAVVPPARSEAAAVARQVSAQVAALLPGVESAERAATGEWREAYLALRGMYPAEAVPSVPTLAAAARPASGTRDLALARPLGGHAYDFFDAWNAERDGYGAYTYILLRSAEDLRSAPVRERYQRLLDIVQRQTDARDVPADVAPSLNLFCIPVLAARARARPDLSYNSALGNQLKLRVQIGLFTRPELRARMTSSTGPFLVTVPKRIGAANSSSPLLFADLSQYPEGAVRDLVLAYMGTLLKDFPTQQALWRPPVPQRVALSMIWFASETSTLVQAAIPAAEARPR